MQKKLKDFQARLRKAANLNVLQLIKANEAYIIDLNTGQLMRGELANGESTGEYLSLSYATFKQSLNPLGVVDLKLTGAFHDSFFLDTSRFPVQFGATDPKTKDLVEKYSKEIFGLTEESKRDMLEHLRAQVEAYYRKVLGL